MPDTPGAPPLQTVDRALELLLSFTERRSSWGVTELAAEFGYSTSTAHRLLASLASRGFLHEDADTLRYHLGPSLWRMSILWERTGGLARLADPTLLGLVALTGRSAVFAVPDGVYVRVVATQTGALGPAEQHSFLNDLFPAHAGAAGRAYYSFLPAAERDELLAGRHLGRYSKRTTVDQEALEAMFATCSEAGYALSEGEFNDRSRALAVPVFIGGRVIGSLTLLEAREPEVETDGAELLSFLPSLQDGATAISRQLSVSLHRTRGGGRR